ncbi:MAG TPA: AAA family ATPase [Kofleriaceae bacterium]|jgi:energy-coupling factor transporter ATP-binding protein EcfA2|nr:AAA family ATPase [Kofleriaceae bacterium]
MKLVRAQVQNYRSVEDSTAFRIDGGTTCLVGKNESGKTALLTALHRLNPVVAADAAFERQRDYPRRYLADYEERHPDADAIVVRTWWTLDDAEFEKARVLLGREAITGHELLVEKGYNNHAKWLLQIDECTVVSHLLDTSNLSDDDKNAVRSENVAALKAVLSTPPAGTQPARAELIARIDREFPNGSVSAAIEKLLPLPQFMLFSQYQRLQGQVSLESIQKAKGASSLSNDDQVFLALCDLAGTTVEKVSDLKTFEGLVSRFEAASNKLTNEIFAYWSQNRFLTVQFRLDQGQADDPPPFNTGRVFRTRIHNKLHQVTVPFDERSAGFVWFFSFLALFSQVKKRNPNVVLLLDEPGQTLHAKAQGDLMRYFAEKLAPHHQVIYTTHSPFMVPSENLGTVRTVEDVVDHRDHDNPIVHGTKVGSDVLSTDRDTIFPLQSALGYEITQSLFVGKDTLLVEGPSDLLYLKAFSSELHQRGRIGLDPRWTICPVGGIDKVAAFMSLFGGNGLHVAVLTDFASGQKKRVDDLRRSALLRAGHVFTADAYAGQAEADIEDLFGPDIYSALVGASVSATVPVAPSGTRCVKFTEDHFKMTTSLPEFDHYAPAAYLIEHTHSVLEKVSAAVVIAAMDRFERLFVALNGLLPAQAVPRKLVAQGSAPQATTSVDRA